MASIFALLYFSIMGIMLGLSIYMAVLAIKLCRRGIRALDLRSQEKRMHTEP